MDYGKQTSLTDALCNAILRQGDAPSPAEWERIKALAERVREEPIATNYNQLQVKLQPTGLDHLDMAFLRATGRVL